ncbi:TetR/AcrR family transcriptional regulator [Kibdelosporangium aridum]|uniref:TetR/AcrR family transcriptional regulator n=1 Tax=Kibdelosporangium aridum TaxID=2030 RepID=A0A428ZED2_KIBAR|nr:TetR/AcrR family transcriptional regulator [Kibdelosporangium aridum]RSM86330.1 TetR/AcrR family transcriptional regulator [Kibdelosporangium aridum]
MTRTSYHHGSLRETLLQATLQLIEADGIGAVSLRQVARTAGVSPRAPYHHFPDRAALLTALSDEGFRRLAVVLTEARAAAATPTEALESILNAYVTFAKTNPAYFRLMFRPELKQSHKSESGMEAGEAAFGVLVDTVDECLATKAARAADKDVLAITIWSLAHGYATLWVEGQLDRRTDDPAALACQVAALFTSLTTAPR